MLDTLLRLAPVLAGFVTGYMLRQFRVARRSDGEMIFKLVFYVCSPALVFVSLAHVELDREILVLPFLSLLTAVGGFFAGRAVATRLNLSPTQLPLFLIACMIVNTGFALPFVQAVYGAEGVAALAAFDLVNTTLTFTWMYAIAARANPGHTGEPVLLRKLYTSPPIYALAAGLLVNLLGWELPDAIASVATTFGNPTGFLITLAIGIVFTPAAIHIHGSVLALTVRLVSTLAIGSAVVFLFDLSGTERGVVFLLCVAPIGFNTVTFASLEKLDVDFASSTLSISIVLGVVLSSVMAILLA
jgi:malate permease and related proteins